jgi:arginyl-tRNA synthetase
MYTHARLSSILRKHGASVTTDLPYARLSQPDEHRIVLKLEQFPRQLQTVCERREPSFLCSYLVDLASIANTYLQRGAKDRTMRVLSDDPELRRARIGLVEATRQVLQLGLGLLGMDAPERM